MIYLEGLLNLDTHIDYLKDKVGINDVFLVGGCIRDLILGINKNPNDIDLTMLGEPKTIYNTINNIKTNKTNKIKKDDLSIFMTEKYGTITIIPKGQKNINKIQYEITPFRQEGNYKDRRHPEEILRSDSLLLDSQRRDFTINSMYYCKIDIDFDILFLNKNNIKKFENILNKTGIIFFRDLNLLLLQDKNIIKDLLNNGKIDTIYIEKFISKIDKDYIFDYTDLSKNFDLNKIIVDKHNIIRIILDPQMGIQDIYNKKLQTVGNPDLRFKEDALRLVRALRLTNIINNKINNIYKGKFIDFEVKTRNSIKKNFFLVKDVSKERLKDEITKSFTNGNPFGFISLLDETNMLKFIFPAIVNCKNIEQPVRYHPFDVYAHTMLCLNALQKINTNYLVRLSMLYHDCGKPEQFYMYKLNLDREEIREVLSGWLNHQKCGLDIAKKDFQNLCFSSKEIEEILWYIEHHHKPGEIIMADKKNREKKIRKLLSDSGFEKVNNLLDICIADRTGQNNPLQNNSDFSDIEELRDILTQLNNNEGQFQKSDLIIDGNDIIKNFGLSSGPIIGEIIDFVFKWVIDDIKNRNKKEKIFTYIKTYKNNL